MSSGGFAYDEPEDLNSSPWLSKPGTYHFAVMDQDPNPTKNNKTEYIDGLKISLAVLAGTNPDQFEKTTDQILFRGKPSNKDGGKFLNGILHRFFVATGLKNGLNPGQRAAINTELLRGRQFIAEIFAEPADNGGHRMKIKGDCIFHVDDPAVAGVPKNQEALAMIPAELRRTASSFTPVGQPLASAPAKPVNPMELLQGQAKPPAAAAPPVQQQASQPAPVQSPPAGSVPAVNPLDV